MDTKTKPPKRSSCFSFDSDDYDSDGSYEDYPNFSIGWPSEVKHIVHVTFDRFRGFLGLPKDFEQQVSKRAPSASQSVFGVAPESMQCAYDTYGNSVPTILLLLQARLYNQGGLQTEGIFRVTAGLDHEENVRSQLNNGIVPTDIDVHALAGLIKAWFRELPAGVIDSLSYEDVKQVADSQDEEGALKLTHELTETNRHLLDWALNLMVDVVEYQSKNLMNGHNIATVFAPNLFQVFDPLTALVHARKVMELLKLLISRKEKDRLQQAQEPVAEGPESSTALPGAIAGRSGNSGVLEGKEEFVVTIRKIERTSSASRAFLLAEELPAGFVNEADLTGSGSEALEEKDPSGPSAIERPPKKYSKSGEIVASTGEAGRVFDTIILSTEAGNLEKQLPPLPRKSFESKRPYIAIPSATANEEVNSSQMLVSPAFVTGRPSLELAIDSPDNPDFPGFNVAETSLELKTPAIFVKSVFPDELDSAETSVTPNSEVVVEEKLEVVQAESNSRDLNEEVDPSIPIKSDEIREEEVLEESTVELLEGSSTKEVELEEESSNPTSLGNADDVIGAVLESSEAIEGESPPEIMKSDPDEVEDSVVKDPHLDHEVSSDTQLVQKEIPFLETSEGKESLLAEVLPEAKENAIDSEIVTSEDGEKVLISEVVETQIVEEIHIEKEAEVNEPLKTAEIEEEITIALSTEAEVFENSHVSETEGMNTSLVDQSSSDAK